MPRETIKARNARVSALLAEYDAANREANKLAGRVKELKEEILKLEAGGYGEWALAFGTPRVLFDQKAAKVAMTEAGIPIPMTTSRPAIVATFTGA